MKAVQSIILMDSIKQGRKLDGSFLENTTTLAKDSLRQLNAHHAFELYIYVLPPKLFYAPYAQISYFKSHVFIPLMSHSEKLLKDR